MPPEFNVRLPYCWICRGILSDSGGAQQLIRHEHHIVPRAFGGADGPTVTLCTGDHSLLHNVGLKLISNKSYFTLTSRLKPEVLERVLYLATRVKIAHDYAKGDPNKFYPIVFKLDNETKEQLDQLKNFHKATNRQDLIKSLIKSEFKRVFQRR